MRRITIVILCGSVWCAIYAQQARRRAVAPPTPATPPPAAGSAISGLTAAQTAAFNEGRATFTRRETPATGLGPVFNDDSCSQCHNDAAVGGGSPRNVTRFGRRVNGVFDPLTELGGSLIQLRSLPGFTVERVPPEATITSQRRTTPLFGLGLIDATADADFVALAASQKARGDGVEGRVNMADNIRAGTKTVGRFGWKAQVPTLFQFAGDALLNEMGITTPDFPSENCPQGNCAQLALNPSPGINDSGNRSTTLTNYMQMLAPPPRGTQSAATASGEQIFQIAGCAECHLATLTTGSSPIAALDHQTYHPYSDFLIHDMGSLGDGLEMGIATGSEMRTEPLWGLRFVTRYLHDGRAGTLDQAITAHDGQARAARDRYTALTPDAKAQLIAFLQSL
jgi:CxxC motif-containing protein (DUF1111 family)